MGLITNTSNYTLKWVHLTLYKFYLNIKKIGENIKDSSIAYRFHGTVDLSHLVLHIPAEINFFKCPALSMHKLLTTGSLFNTAFLY